MKLPIIVTILFILLILSVYVSVTELNDINRTQRKEIDFLLRRNEKLEQENKSFRVVLDSLKIEIR